MSTLVQKTFFEKVDRTGCIEGELGKVIHGEYEQHGETLESTDPRILRYFRKQMKAKGYEEISTGCFKHTLRTHFGIKSYHTVELVKGVE